MLQLKIGDRMKKRVLWKMFLLSIVTLGIYRVYWFIKTRNEIMRLKPEAKIWSPYILLVPVAIAVLSFVALVASMANSPQSSPSCSSNSYYSDEDYTTGSQALSSPGEENCDTSAGSIIGIIGFYVGLFVAYILFIVWVWRYAKGVEVVSNGTLSFALAIIVLLLIPDGFDILVIQDHFNKLNLDQAPQANLANPGAGNISAGPPPSA